MAGANPAEVKADVSECDTWNTDGSGSFRRSYHSWASFCLVCWGQTIHLISLVVIIPTASDYAISLGQSSQVFFAIVVGLSSIIEPFTSSCWRPLLAASNYKTVMTINALLNLFCALLYVAASIGSPMALIASRFILGFGSVQTFALQYIQVAVTKQELSFSHYMTSAVRSYAYAVGIGLAFALTIVAEYTDNEDWFSFTLPGWVTAFLWATYLPLHYCFFVEPPVNGEEDLEHRAIVEKSSSSTASCQVSTARFICFVGILIGALVTGAIEVLTVQATVFIFAWSKMRSALFLAGIMLLVVLNTLTAYLALRWKDKGLVLVVTFGVTSLILPVYFIAFSQEHQTIWGTTHVEIIYFAASVASLSTLNIARTVAILLTVELPTSWPLDIVLEYAVKFFTMGRGVGPIMAVTIANKTHITIVLSGLSATATLITVVPYVKGWFGRSSIYDAIEDGEDLVESQWDDSQFSNVQSKLIIS